MDLAGRVPPRVVTLARAVLPERVYRGLRRRLLKRTGGRTVVLQLPQGSGGRGGGLHRVVMRAPSVMYVPRRLSKTGLAGYEPEALPVFLAALEAAGPGAVLDIGANVGVYGLVARALTDRDVHAFEPVPALATIARDTGTRNGIPYSVHGSALGRTTGTATLYLSDVTDTSNSLASGFRASHESLEVRVETLDDVVERTGLIPAVIKIDTETTEPDVIAGASDTLARHRPWLLVEVLPNRVEEALAEAMRPWRYTWYHCDGSAVPTARTTFRDAGSADALMWLLAPEPLTDEFWSAVALWRERLAACVPAQRA